MDILTIIVALAAGVLVFCVRPTRALVVYLAALTWYPSYLSIRLGTIDFTVSRIVIILLFVSVLVQTDLARRYRMIWLDKLVIIYFVCQVLAGAMTTELGNLLENRAGAFFDMALPYFAVRLILVRRENYLSFLKGVLVVAAPIAILGVFQSITGRDPVYFLQAEYHVPDIRHGFYRAKVTFSHSIMLGLLFAIFGSMAAGLLHRKLPYKRLGPVGLVLMAAGVGSSMSSGPILAALVATIAIATYHYRRYTRELVVIGVLMCGVVEIVSNRHFYDVLGDFTFNPATAWYRSKLIDAALFKGGMSGHWLTGFGFVDPGWSALIDKRDHTDIVNHYLLVLSQYGLVGLVPFLVVLVLAIKRLLRGYHLSMTNSDRWLVWCVGSSLLGLLLAFQTVSLFGPPKNMFFMLLAVCGSLPVIMAAGRRVVGGVSVGVGAKVGFGNVSKRSSGRVSRTPGRLFVRRRVRGSAGDGVIINMGQGPANSPATRKSNKDNNGTGPAV